MRIKLSLLFMHHWHVLVLICDEWNIRNGIQFQLISLFYMDFVFSFTFNSSKKMVLLVLIWKRRIMTCKKKRGKCTNIDSFEWYADQKRMSVLLSDLCVSLKRQWQIRKSCWIISWCGFVSSPLDILCETSRRQSVPYLLIHLIKNSITDDGTFFFLNYVFQYVFRILENHTVTLNPINLSHKIKVNCFAFYVTSLLFIILMALTVIKIFFYHILRLLNTHTK